MTVALKHWFLKQPLLLPALSLASTIVIVDSSNKWLIIGWLILTFSILISALCSRKVLFLCSSISVAGALIHHDKLSGQQQVQEYVSYLNKEPLEVYGIVNSSPRSLPKSTEAIIKIIHCPNSKILNDKKILAYIPNKPTLNVGEKIWLQGKLSSPSPVKNPQVFDRPTYLHRQSISAIFQADNIFNEHDIATSYYIASYAEKSRRWIHKKLTLGIEDTKASEIILAMFLGEKPNRNGQIINAFKNSGTIHVFAVSGLHVMMIGAIFTILLKLCRASPPIWIPIVILIMFFYAIVTGMKPPAMRASIMGAIVLTATLLPRKPSLPSCLWLSAIIALLWNTHSLFLPGFQLSYLVLIAIAFTSQWWMNRYEWISHIDPFMPESLLNKRQIFTLSLRRKSSTSLAVSTSAWTGSSFLIWLYFGIITPLAIIASLPLMLIVFLILGTCCLSLFFGSISPSLGAKVNILNMANAKVAHQTSRFFSSIPNARYQSQPWSKGERVIIYHLDDGGGVYLSLGGGILLDAGNKSKFQSQVYPSLKKNGARIDTLIASHADIKHIEGLTQTLTEFPIKQILVPSKSSRSPAHKELITKAKNLGIKIIIATESRFPITKDSYIEIIHKPKTSLPLADDRCLAFMLYWHDQSILFLNDSGHYFSHWLRQEQSKHTMKKLQPDMLVIGKHSRDSSLHPEIIELLSPKSVIATQAYYPAEQSRTHQWIHKVEQLGTNVYLLNESGAITITQKNGLLDLNETIQSSKD